jgi:hypothetical protein
VNEMQEPTQMVVLDAVNAAVGPLPGVESVMSSTAKDGSVPTPSSLLFHRKPIFIPGLLLALAGSRME